MSEEFSNILKSFPNQKVLVVGDLILDRYLFGEVNRISSEAPVPVLDINEIRHILGGAANLANNVKALGAKVSLVGVVGSDGQGEIIKDLLLRTGISSQGIITDEKRKTTLKTRAFAKNQQLLCLGYEDRNLIDADVENKILAFIQKEIQGAALLIISDYERGVVTPSLIKKIIDFGNQKKINVFADLKGVDYVKYKDCGFVTLNKNELARALGTHIADEGKLDSCAKKMLSDLQASCVLVKMGGEGMALFQKDGNVFHCQAFNKKPRDVSGAGDTALAVFALSVGAGANFDKAMHIASHACGIAVSKIGTAVVLPHELERSLKNNLV